MKRVPKVLWFTGVVLLTLIVILFIGPYDKTTPERKAQQKAQVATMEAKLYNVQVGDFLEMKGDYYVLVTHLINKGCRYSDSPIRGQGDRQYYDSMAYQVIKIYKKNSVEATKFAILYCNQSLN